MKRAFLSALLLVAAPAAAEPDSSATAPASKAEVLEAAFKKHAGDLDTRELNQFRIKVLAIAGQMPKDPREIAAFIAKQAQSDQRVLNVLNAFWKDQVRPIEPAAPAKAPAAGPTPGRAAVPQSPAAAALAPGWEYRRQLARAVSRASPDDPDAARDYGEVAFYSGEPDTAARELRRSMEMGVRDSQTVTLYGRAIYALGDYQQAHEAGEAALKLDPANRDAEVLYKLSAGRASKVILPPGLASIGGGIGAGALPPAPVAGSQAAEAPADQTRRAELAVAAARQSVVAPSKIQQSAAITREVEAALRIGDYPDAHARASQAIALNAQNAQAWNYRAMAASNMQRYSEAVYDASYAISLDPARAPAMVTRSWAFAKQGHFAQARQDALGALEKDPSNAYAFHGLAYALAGQNDNRGALEALKNAAERDARFKPKYEQALQAAESADMTFLFADAPAQAAAAPPPSPASRRSRFFRLIALSLSGGLLVALGILHAVSASWRDKVRATIRRALAGGSAPEAGGAGPAPGVASSGAAFWERYELVRELGSGGMGVVFEARDLSLDRRVAVKKMRDEIRADPVERRRFVLEARTVAALHHPNIVDIYSIVEQDQEVYLVFEHVSGRTLSDRLRDGPLPFSEARRLMAGACAAVEYAHQHKVIHRDLKPSNIMVADDGAVKVMDFGVARQAKDAMTKMTRTDTIVGTPPYMAPEQEQGTVRRESDVFALGVVLYEALCGELPFSGVGAGMLLNKINGRHQPLSRGLSRSLPPGLDEIIAKALAPDPDRRYRTPAQLLAALEALPASAASERPSSA